MQKENLPIFLNTIATVIRECIPEEKAKTTLAMEYGLSPAEMSDLSNGKKDVKYSTLFFVSEILGIKIDEFSKRVREKLPEDFTFIDL